MYKEIDKLVGKGKLGDKDSLEEILKMLKPLVISSIKKYYNNFNEYEDLIQMGNLTILQCIKDFDEEKGVYFLGYVKTTLRYVYLNKHKEEKILSLNNNYTDSDDELIDILESEDVSPLEYILIKERNEHLYNALNTLTNRQIDILIYFYIERLSIKDISQELNIAYRTIVNTKVNALKKLKHYLKNQ